jgi:MOSC domain-containing protein YiiM
MQGDRDRHGGPEKAVHHYPFDHYEAWKRDLGDHETLGEAGAFGENLSTVGIVEDGIFVGDVFSLGSAIVEVSQGRQPCWRLNERFGRKTMGRDVQSTGRTGWYYRVLQEGLVAPDARLVLLDRKSPEWTLARIWRAFYVDTLNADELSGVAAIRSLADGWRSYALRRLDSGMVEDWSRRLDGQPGA